MTGDLIAQSTTWRFLCLARQRFQLSEAWISRVYIESRVHFFSRCLYEVISASVIAGILKFLFTLGEKDLSFLYERSIIMRWVNRAFVATRDSLSKYAGASLASGLAVEVKHEFRSSALRSSALVIAVALCLNLFLSFIGKVPMGIFGLCIRMLFLGLALAVLFRREELL